MRFGEAAAIVVGFLSVCMLWPRVAPMQVARTPGHASALQATVRSAAPTALVLGRTDSLAALDQAALAREGIVLIPDKRSASARWYLTLKNCIPQETTQTVVIFFSDVELTMPEKRVHAKRDRAQLDALATAHEPLLDRLSYHERMDWWEYTLSEKLPIYRSRASVQATMRQAPTALLSYGLNLPPARLQSSKAALFSPERWDPVQRATYEQARSVAREAYDQRYFAFESQCESSFLPAIISTAKQRSIRLLFVAVPGRMQFAEGEHSMAAAYQAALAAYLSAHDAAYLDLRTTPHKQWTSMLLHAM